MKATINGKRYDTSKCNELASYDHYNHSNNYSGTTYLLEASNGDLLVYTDSNGQDCWLRDSLIAWEDYQGDIDSFDPIDEERMVELGLIKIID